MQPLPVGVGQGVTASLVDQQIRPGDQLGGPLAADRERHDLVVVAVHDQRGNVHLGEIEERAVREVAVELRPVGRLARPQTVAPIPRPPAATRDRGRGVET